MFALLLDKNFINHFCLYQVTFFFFDNKCLYIKNNLINITPCKKRFYFEICILMTMVSELNILGSVLPHSLLEKMLHRVSTDSFWVLFKDKGILFCDIVTT